MTEAAALTAEERLRQLLGHLGIAQAHFVTRVPDDSSGLARVPEMVSSLTAIGGVDPQAVEPLAARLLVITGDRGRNAEAVRAAMPRLRDAQLVTLRDYEIFAWTDLATERTEELGAAMMRFLARISPSAAQPSALAPAGEGEFAAVMWRPGKLRFLIGVKNPLPIDRPRPPENAAPCGAPPVARFATPVGLRPPFATHPATLPHPD